MTVKKKKVCACVSVRRKRKMLLQDFEITAL